MHTRRPVKLTREAGALQALAFALLIGGTPVSFLLSPPLYALFFISLVLPIDALNALFPSPILQISLANLLLGNAVMVYVTMMGAFKRRRYRWCPGRCSTRPTG